MNHLNNTKTDTPISQPVEIRGTSLNQSSLSDTAKVSVLLGIVLFISFILRFYGIWNSEHTDEYNEIFEALRVCSGHLNFHRWGKRFFLYILWKYNLKHA